MKKIFLVFLSLFILFSCSWWNKETIKAVSNKQPWFDKINVVTSIVPLASIINNIWQDEVKVTNIVPAWVSPHWFDMKLNQMSILRRSDLIVEVWLEHIDWFLNRGIKNENVLNLSKWVTLLDSNEEDEHKILNKEEKNENEKDPHIWLWIENVKIIAWKIKDELSSLRPEKKEYFEQNYNNFILEIDNITKDFNLSTSWKNQTNFIVFHDAYNYLFQDLWINSSNKTIYNSNILVDINSKRLSWIEKEVIQKKVKFIFKEPQMKNGNIKIFSEKNKLILLELDPLWTDTWKDWYINNLKINLDNLKKIYE